MNTTPLEQAMTDAGLPIAGTSTPKQEHELCPDCIATFHKQKDADGAGRIVRIDWCENPTSEMLELAERLLAEADLNTPMPEPPDISKVLASIMSRLDKLEASVAPAIIT